MKKRALITGIFGQDGSYMSEILHRNGYEIIGIPNPGSFVKDQPKIAEFEEKYAGSTIYYVDIIKEEGVFSDLLSNENTRPTEIYNFAGVSNVFSPYSDLARLVDLNCKIPAIILENIVKHDRSIKFIQASSILSCISHSYAVYPYGLSKSFVDRIMNQFRLEYGVKCYSMMLSTHASERMNENFFMRKLSMGIAKIKLGLTNTLRLGDLSVKRDIGYAPEFMELCFRFIETNYAIGGKLFLNTGNYVCLEDIVRSGCEYAGVSMDCILSSKDHARPYNNDTEIPVTNWGDLVPTPPTEFIKTMIDHDISLLKSAQ